MVVVCDAVDVGRSVTDAVYDAVSDMDRVADPV